MPTPEVQAQQQAAAWQRFVERLGEQLAAAWPAMPERLGERYPAFVEAAVQQALERGLSIAAGVARYANLWFVWGPAFHDKPGFEWAQALLARVPPGTDAGNAEAGSGGEWPLVHQLVQRSLAELARLPGTRIEPAALAASDARLIESFAALGRRGALHPPQPPELPLKSCDLEAAELRLLDEPPALYRAAEGDAGEWQRGAAAAVAPLRVDAAHPLPPRLWMLSPQGTPARLQVRARALAVCDADRHPAVELLGPHGRWRGAGHETRAISWPLAAREQPLAQPGAVVAEETSPEFHRLKIETCGLRDEGDAIGPVETLVAALPAGQWWVQVQRARPDAQTVLTGANGGAHGGAPRAWVRPTTRCRLECDGRKADAAALERVFADGLDADVATGVQRLAAAWERVPGLAAPGLDATLGLLAGRAAFTWGWQAGALDRPAVMRVLAQFEMRAIEAAIELTGTLALAGTTSRLALRVQGEAALPAAIAQQADAGAAAAPPAAARASWRLPFVAALDPLATDEAALSQLAGATSGALVGEAGWRPRARGGSGLEWFVRLVVEPVAVVVEVADPLLGARRQPLALLPALTLVDWSSG